jgi:hypothetical protein
MRMRLTSALMVALVGGFLAPATAQAPPSPARIAELSEQWVDPLTDAPPGTTYHLFETASRGKGSKGSYLICQHRLPLDRERCAVGHNGAVSREHEVHLVLGTAPALGVTAARSERDQAGADPGHLAGEHILHDGRRAAGYRPGLARRGPMGTVLLGDTQAGRLRIQGCAGNPAPDHVDLLHALPDWLRMRE